jgi:hypothetical protein
MPSGGSSLLGDPEEKQQPEEEHNRRNPKMGISENGSSLGKIVFFHYASGDCM